MGPLKSDCNKWLEESTRGCLATGPLLSLNLAGGKPMLSNFSRRVTILRINRNTCLLDGTV